MKIIDVREQNEFKTGHVEGAINIPLSTIVNNPKLKELSKDEKLVAYCRSGNRSGMAVQTLSDMGFTDVVNGINQQNVEQNYL